MVEGMWMKKKIDNRDGDRELAREMLAELREQNRFMSNLINGIILGQTQPVSIANERASAAPYIEVEDERQDDPTPTRVAVPAWEHGTWVAGAGAEDEFAGMKVVNINDLRNEGM